MREFHILTISGIPQHLSGILAEQIPNIFVCDEIIPPGAAKRIKGYTDDSVGSLMREPNRDRTGPRGMVEFRVLDFNVVQ
jgi:hypothetical protein